MTLPSSSSAAAEDRFVLFTGGDDTALAVCGASLVYGDASIDAAEAIATPMGALPSVSASVVGFKCRLIGGWSVVRAGAHASAIRSLALHGSRLYSAGYDQRVKVWRIEQLCIDSGCSDPAAPTVVLQLVGSCFADVMDVTTLRVLDEREGAATASVASSPSPPMLALAGQGWQLLQIVE